MVNCKNSKFLQTTTAKYLNEFILLEILFFFKFLQKLLTEKEFTNNFEILNDSIKTNLPLPTLSDKNKSSWFNYGYGVDFEWARTEFECELCTSLVPVTDIISMIACTHYACRDCLAKYFTIQIRDRHRLVITCPFCDEPAIGGEEDEKLFDYMALFDPFIRHIVQSDVYELFSRKLRDRALMRDPNFLWCSQVTVKFSQVNLFSFLFWILFFFLKCSSGFIAPNPIALTVMCPDCCVLICRKCKKPVLFLIFSQSFLMFFLPTVEETTFQHIM